MANYRTHVSFGAAVGAITAAVGVIWIPGVGWGALFLGTFFGFIGGMVPDLDHDGGTALVKITALFSTLLPVVLLAAWGQGEGNWTSWSLLVLLQYLTSSAAWIRSRPHSTRMWVYRESYSFCHPPDPSECKGLVGSNEKYWRSILRASFKSTRSGLTS